jgi:hypothetical protein
MILDIFNTDLPKQNAYWMMCNCDCTVNKNAPCFVFWNELNYCYSAIIFCKENDRLDSVTELFRLKNRQPFVCEKPQWITKERIDKQLKYYKK